MRFISDKFSLDGIHCSEKDVSLTWGEDAFINYGLEYKKELDYDGINWTKNADGQPSTIKLNIAYEIDNVAQTWDKEKLRDIENWVMTEDFVPFISDDDEDTTYYLQGVNTVRRMNADMKGWLEVEFQPMSSYGYKNQTVTLRNTSRFLDMKNTPYLRIINLSDLKDPYYPIIKIVGLNGEISIINATTNKTFTLSGSGNIVIDNKTKNIRRDDGKYFLAQSNREWIYFNQGLNNIQVLGDCESVSFISQYEVRV